MFSMTKTKLEDQLEFMIWLSEKDREKAIRLSSLIEAERERHIAAHPEMTQPAGLLGALGNEKISIYQYKHWDSFLTNPESLEKILTGFLPDEKLDWMTVGRFLEFVHEKLIPNCSDAVYWLMRWYMDTGRLEVEGKIKEWRASIKEYNMAQGRQKAGDKTKELYRPTSDAARKSWDSWKDIGKRGEQAKYIKAMVKEHKVSERAVQGWIRQWKGEKA